MKESSGIWVGVGVVAVALIVWLGSSGGAAKEGDLSGTIEIDGSSTVFPITEAVAEEFRKEQPNVQVNIGVSGTGGGFKRFTNNETDISNASRPIKQTEIEAAQKNGITYDEYKVGIDGLAIITHKNTSFTDCITTQELKKIWAPESTVKTWRDVRSDWPNEPIKLYGPGTDSGTFDYFTEVVNGKEGSIRSDFTASEDDNILVRGVAGDQYSLGYFGYAYYQENTDKLKLLAVDAGKGCIAPSQNTIEDGTYAPLARPIFIYAKKSSLARKEVAEFTRYYLDHARELVAEVGYTPFTADVYSQEAGKLEQTLKSL